MVMLAAPAGAAVTPYAVTAIISNFNGQAINSGGWVAGYSEDAGGVAKAGLYNGVSVISLGTLGGETHQSRAYAVNDQGQVAGFSGPASGTAGRQAFIHTDGSMTAVSDLTGSYNAAYGINNSGTTAGYYTTSATPVTSRAYSVSGGVVSYLPAPVSTTAEDINDDGWITGGTGAVRQAYLSDGPGMTYLGTLGGETSSGNALNTHHQVVGYSTTSGVTTSSTRAFLYEEGIMRNIQTGTLWETRTGYAEGINDDGQVVGRLTGGSGVAFIWDEGVMYDLNSLLDTPISGTALRANDINNGGQIIVTYTSGGQTHTAILSPIPEPGSLSLLAAAGFTAARRRRRRSS